MKKCKPIGAILINLFFIFTFFPYNLMAQKSCGNSPSEIVELYTISESMYPVNDEFINGCIYPQPNIQILGNPYFENTEWHLGTLFINGKEYPKILLKYDLILDELIIKTKAEENIERLITVNKSQIDSFNIGLLCFVNSRNLFPTEEKNTYFEKVYQSKLSVYKHYDKAFIDMYSNSSPAGKFSSQKNDTYLFDNQKLTDINRLKSFLEYFEKTDKEKIKKYIKTNNINYKKISDSQIVELLEFCTSHITY